MAHLLNTRSVLRMKSTLLSVCRLRNTLSTVFLHASRGLHQSCVIRSAAGPVSLQQGTESVEITWHRPGTHSNGHSSYHYVWLRDNCQCPHCYHPETHQRLSDVLQINPHLRPKWVELSDRDGDSSVALSVEWSDGHKSVYPVTWLERHSYDWRGERSCGSEVATDSSVAPSVWGREIGDAPPLVKYDHFMKDDRVFLEWSDKVDRYGFCFIDGIPLEPDFSKQVLERVGVLRHTFYGDFWDFEVNSKPKDELKVGDTAYTALPIDSHTDSNYFHEAPGLQMLHVLHFNGAGGDSVLVDGFKLADVIRNEHPEHYQILSQVPFDFHYTDKNNRYVSSFIPFMIDPESGKVFQVHFNNYDRSPISTSTMNALQRAKPNGSIVDIYRAIQTFTKSMRDVENQYRFLLKPGRAVIFDNHRVLHARMSFTGNRRLCGGYVNREDWRSRARVAREKV